MHIGFITRRTPCSSRITICSRRRRTVGRLLRARRLRRMVRSPPSFRIPAPTQRGQNHASHFSANRFASRDSERRRQHLAVFFGFQCACSPYNVCFHPKGHRTRASHSPSLHSPSSPHEITEPHSCGLNPKPHDCRNFIFKFRRNSQLSDGDPSPRVKPPP
jgi:hypothetical protein